MNLRRVLARTGLALAAGWLAAGCAGVAVPVSGGLIDTLELPALPQLTLVGAALSQGHTAEALRQAASYPYFSPYSLCEH